jgi:hypothetical protein
LKEWEEMKYVENSKVEDGSRQPLTHDEIKARAQPVL